MNDDAPYNPWTPSGKVRARDLSVKDIIASIETPTSLYVRDRLPQCLVTQPSDLDPAENTQNA